ncbi:hypothetical protein KDW23_19585 [Burkholderia cenocepacia]|uniref:hypothetical protein n=1 Tax=Burkholderia cenocepacia TaxID=95486 RepID=UPI001B8E9A68|nr:hypothetical protein [Burkholderia cenocepacia]MBR8072131.1 hypothetical protein [Burkholderia cenocepacia]MBR8446913.1 hypothetical protein [Burkholderia cenocepacia]
MHRKVTVYGKREKPVIGSAMSVAGMLPKRAPAFVCRKPCVADQVGGAQRVPDHPTVVAPDGGDPRLFVEAECGVEVA